MNYLILQIWESDSCKQFGLYAFIIKVEMY
jgi:hypothetical protein